MAGALTPAGLGGCVNAMMDRGLVDFIISTGANLYHDLHYALNFTLHRGSPFLDDVDLYKHGIIRIYDVLFPSSVLLETDAYLREFLVREQVDGRCRLPSSIIGWDKTCSSATLGARRTRWLPRPHRLACPSTHRRPAIAPSV